MVRTGHGTKDLFQIVKRVCQGCILCFAGGSGVKESACNAGDWGSIPGLGRPPREGNEYPLQYSCLGNPMDKEPGIFFKKIYFNWRLITL